MKSGAFKIAAIYTVSGLLWIILSDKLLNMVAGRFSVSFILFLSSAKGFAYVLLTGIILYKLIANYSSRLEESERQYRSYFETNPTPMWVFNRRTLNFITVNNAAIARYGYTLEEFKNLTILDIRPKSDVAKVYTRVKEMKDRYNDSGVWTHLKKDGTPIQVHITSHTISSPGREDRIMVMATEIIVP